MEYKISGENTVAKIGLNLAAAFLVAGLCFIFFYKIGSHPIVDWDEGIYAEIAHQSLQTHSIADLHWYGNASKSSPNGIWFEKPPLMFWLMEVAYQIFGVTEFAVRFWSTLFALAVAFLSYFYAIRLFKSKLVGVLTLAVFYLAHFFITQAWFMKMDIPVTFFILLSFYSFELARHKKKYFLLFWAALGLGVLTKSIIGLLPLPIITIFLIATKDWRWLKSHYFYYGLILFAFITIPWHLIETLRYGTVFWQSYLGYQIFHRYVATVDNHSGSFWYYAGLFRDNLIFATLSLFSLGYFLFKSFKNKENKAYLLLSIAVIFIFLLFSLANTKLASYIVPLYPFLIIMVAKSLNDFFGLIKKVWIKTVAVSLVCLLFIISGFIFNQSKINDNGYYSHYYYEDKEFMQFATQDFPNLNILAVNRDLPSLIFYANRQVYGWTPATKLSPGYFIVITNQPPMWPQSRLIAQGQTARLYLVDIQ